MTNAWAKTDTEVVNTTSLEENNVRASIAFSFFSILSWVRLLNAYDKVSLRLVDFFRFGFVNQISKGIYVKFFTVDQMLRKA